MKSIQEHMGAYQQSLQAAIPEEQVWGVGMFSRAGSAKGFAIGAISPAAGMIARGGGKKLAPGFPLNVIFAVTPTRLIAYDYKPRMSGLKLKRRVVEWPRQAVHVEVVPAAGALGRSRVRFHVAGGGPAGGTTVELESPITFGQSNRMNDSFYGALGLAAPI